MTMYARCTSICIVEISHFCANAKTIFAPHCVSHAFHHADWHGRSILTDGTAPGNRFELSQYSNRNYTSLRLIFLIHSHLN
jgi:hypothetical protein